MTKPKVRLLFLMGVIALLVAAAIIGLFAAAGKNADIENDANKAGKEAAEEKKHELEHQTDAEIVADSDVDDTVRNNQSDLVRDGRTIVDKLESELADELAEQSISVPIPRDPDTNVDKDTDSRANAGGKSNGAPTRGGESGDETGASDNSSTISTDGHGPTMSRRLRRKATYFEPGTDRRRPQQSQQRRGYRSQGYRPRDCGC